MSYKPHLATYNENQNARALYPGEVPDATIVYSIANNNNTNAQDANHNDSINQKHSNDTIAVIDIEGDGKYRNNIHSNESKVEIIKFSVI